MDGVHNLWGRVLIVLVCLAIGLVFPWAFLGAAFVAYTLYGDIRDVLSGKLPEPLPEIEKFYDRESEYSWQELSEFRTESVAEQAFLKAMIDAFDLKPAGDDLAGGGIRFGFQREILRYRVDFILDDWLIVEIDGAEWHSSPEAVERDRIRDAALRELDYSILRIPAKVVFQAPQTAITRVRSALLKPTIPITVIERDRRAKAAKPKKQWSLTGGVKALGDALDSMDSFIKEAEERQKADAALAEAKQAFEIEKALIENAIVSAETDILLDKMSAESRKSLDENMAELGMNSRARPRRPDWPKVSFDRPAKTGDEKFDAMVDVRFGFLKEERSKHFQEAAERLSDPKLQRYALKNLDETAGLFLPAEIRTRLGINIFDI